MVKKTFNTPRQPVEIAGLVVILWLVGSGPCRAATWLRAGLTSNRLVWGIQGGLQFAIPPDGFRGRDPRGLIRLGYPILADGGYDLINFIAIEPVVKGKKGLSELEFSALDHVQGKRLWVSSSDRTVSAETPDPGKLELVAPGVEQLEITLRVERFQNGAHVFLVITQRSDAPDEITLTVRSEPDSNPMASCVLTATMGNLIRARRLWLKDGVINSWDVYGEYQGSDFAPPTFVPLDRLSRLPSGDVVVAMTTNEPNPASIFPYPGTAHWHYGGASVTQYWRAQAHAGEQRPEAVVNARRVYWKTEHVIPGGVAYENFELREPFHDGQQFVFGITRKTPEEIGIAGK